jgi:hypothetical protein
MTAVEAAGELSKALGALQCTGPGQAAESRAGCSILVVSRTCVPRAGHVGAVVGGQRHVTQATSPRIDETHLVT